MAKYKLKRRCFSKFDNTDELKKMKDSDILAEKKIKPETSIGNVAGTAAAGAAIGGAALGATGMFKKGAGKLASMKSRGKFGLAAGATVAGLAALSKRSKEKKETSFYNDRLGYAQNQAKRREKKDWKSNISGRDGYSY